jgi:hypothetical protein
MLSRYDWATRQRPAPVLMLAAAYSFSTRLTVYYLVARFSHLSFATWIAIEVTGILFDVLQAVARPGSKYSGL